MANTTVGQAKWEALLAQLAALGVRPEDLEEQFVQARGPGGQHVNRSATGVVLRYCHGKQTVVIKADTARSQRLNRYYARLRLLHLLDPNARPQAAKNKLARARKQKDRRARRAKRKASPQQPT